jgi:Na+-driven multidrug efflux pump
VLWGVSVPMQTAILGHLSADAIAANSVATTFYQYLKVIVMAMSSTSAVMIGNAIGKGDLRRIKSDARTLAVLDVVIGLILGIVLILLRHPLLSLYNLSDTATTMALHLIVIMGFVMVGMSYQMPVSFGIIQGGGDAGFTMKMNMISTWCIVMPLSFMAAFWWKLPVEWVVVVIQSDQIFKGLPTFIRMRSYKWIKKLTRAQEDA